MNFIVITPVAPLRREASHRSEMVSQLLFGEMVDGLEKQGEFMKIKSAYDGYEGWCQIRQMTPIEGNEYPFITKYSRNTEDIVKVNGVSCQLSPGSTCMVPDAQQEIMIGKYGLSFSVHYENDISFRDKGAEVLHYARMFLGTSYLWGGRSRYGIDCSGLTQVAFMLSGLFLPRDSGPQSQEGEIVNLLQEARPGDLAFFDNEEGRIVHVGILLNPEFILHASANCRIDRIDHQGIVHFETGERTHHLRIIRRYF